MLLTISLFILCAEKQYTALIPTDEAFYAYYPIDWGFNPFMVESFLRRTLLEHLVEGDVALESLPDGAQVNTLAGTSLTVNNKEGETEIEMLKYTVCKYIETYLS